MWHKSNFKTFSKTFFFLIKGQKSRAFKTKFFFCLTKVEKTKKTGDAKVDKKAPKTITTRMKEKRNKNNVLLSQKKEKNKTKRTKWKMEKKGDEQNEEWKIQEEDTNQERESRRERKRKGDTQKRCSKRKRENFFKKCKKNKNEHIFSKREKTFLHTKRFQLKIKAEKSISCFSKKRKVDAGVQETLSTKLREEIQQLRMNHDSKHREIDTEVKAKEPRREMEQVLELDEANEIIRWSSWPCEGRPEGSGRTQEQPALLVSIPNRRRIQDDKRNRCADACVNSGITHGRPYSSPRAGNPVVEGSIEDPRILSGDVQCQRSDWDVWGSNKLNQRCWLAEAVAAFTVGDQSSQRVRWATSGAKCLSRSTGPQPWPCRARGHTTKRKDETIQTTTWTTHHQTPQRSTTQHSTSWRSATDATLPGHREHTGGSRQDTHGTPVLITIRRPWVAQPHEHAHATQVTDTSCKQQGWRPNSLVAE